MGDRTFKPVVQEDRTGCGIAVVAAATGRRYRDVRRLALAMGIRVGDAALWCDTGPVTRLLRRLSVPVASKPAPFRSWERLPDRALLATKWHLEGGRPAWHWTLFIRTPTGAYVLDSNRALRRHRRTDFGRIKPKWFLPLRLR